MKKGQYIRLLLATTSNPTKVIAAAKQMALHGSAQTEESSTKDTTGDALEYDVTGLSYDITGSGLVLTTNDALLTGANGLNGKSRYPNHNLKRLYPLRRRFAWSRHRDYSIHRNR